MVYTIVRKICRLCWFLFEYAVCLFRHETRLNINANTANPAFFKIGDAPKLAGLFVKLFPGAVQKKSSQADTITAHIFNLLGSGDRKLSNDGVTYQPIDWHTDFKSGHRWNKNTFFRFIRYGKVRGADIKVPWELSRFQHLIILGQAYLLNKDERYAGEYRNQITDWIEHNRVGFGVNWACTMDVAIRAANWLVALEYFKDSRCLDAEFFQKFYSSLYDHAAFIRSHLECGPPTANHYLADIAGLFFISLYCPFFQESVAWKTFCMGELEKEIQRQVYDDGCSFEASTSYHRLALELFFYSALLAQRTGISFSPSYQARLNKMFEFSLYCIKPNGKIPQIGDNDNGRFLIFSHRAVLDHTYLLSLAAIYFKDADFKLERFPFDEEAFWVFGREGYDAWEQIPCRTTELTSKAFPQAGWYIMRHKDDYCFISCGPNGQDGNGGHAHNDKLSFELMMGGEDIIVDPGTYTYTAHPEQRNKFRSTGYHNTIAFEGKEQNSISQKLFHLPDKVRITQAELNETSEEIAFRGVINYANINHSRSIIRCCKSREWKITDCAFSKNNLKGTVIFSLAPHLQWNGSHILLKHDDKPIADVELNSPNINKCSYEFSPEYGVKIDADRLMIEPFFSADRPLEVITTFKP
jgi:hypothetical protein